MMVSSLETSKESFLSRFRIKETVLTLLLGTVLLNIMLGTRLDVLDVNSMQSISNKSVLSNGGIATGLVKFTKISNTTTPIQPKSTMSNAALQCSAFGGPSDEAAAEMVYWRNDIPEDKVFHSIYNGENKYFVYEPDEAGFSNVRLSFENVFAMAKAMGRTLVLPPTMRFAQLRYKHPEGVRSYSFSDFFDISGIPVISMEEYLNRIAMTGQLRNSNGEVSFPPYNRTNWDGRLGNCGDQEQGEAPLFFKWLSESMLSIKWQRDQCIIPFPEKNDESISSINRAMQDILRGEKNPYERIASYNGKPIPVNSSMPMRLREMLADRKILCEYDKEHQAAPSVYMTGHENTGSRPLIHFFADLFFESWEHDLQMKRFIRDHLRFSDIIQCAAARIVQGIREISRNVGNGTNDRGGFDTMHVRREDFKGLDVYKEGLVESHQIIDAKYFPPQRTVYIATDEKDKKFFEPLHQHHTILFLHDFDHLIKDIDPNYYGMIEQLVCAKGDKFVGTYYSTFTGYINRVRGYHYQKTGARKAKTGYLNSEYMGHGHNYRKATHSYVSAQQPFWSREWPAAWRDIDADVPVRK